MPSYLNALCALYERLREDPSSGMPVEGMSAAKVSFAVVLADDGSVIRFDDLRDSKGKPSLLSVPAAVRRTSNSRSDFLWGSSSYVLGVTGKDGAHSGPKTVRDMLEFRTFHKKALAACEGRAAKALLAFLATWKPAMLKDFDEREAVTDSVLVFRLADGTFLLEDPELLRVWDRVLEERDAHDGKDGKPSEMAQCLVTGLVLPIARVHPAIKGVFGAQPAGASLVTCNFPALESFGKEQGVVSPVSCGMARAYASALNWLLNPVNGHLVRVGDTSIVFWTDAADPAETVFTSLMDPSSEEDDGEAVARMKGMLEAARKGERPVAEGKETKAFILGLSPNNGRISVRFWLEGGIASLLANVARWYEDLAIERTYPGDPEFPPLWRLLVQGLAARHEAKNVSPRMAAALAKAMLDGGRFPEPLLPALLARVRAEGKVTFLRAALVRAFLRRNRNMEGGWMDTFDGKAENVGYRLGALFALLEKIRRDAIGRKTKSSFAEAHMTAAMTMPARTFGVLLERATRWQVPKLEFPFEVWFTREVAALLDGMEEFPERLSPTERGLFMLGYYFKKNALYRKKEDA